MMVLKNQKEVISGNHISFFFSKKLYIQDMYSREGDMSYEEGFIYSFL